MPCGPFQELQISDGTTTVNLLSPRSGFCLLEWQPSLAEPKGGGVWRDSQLAESRRLALRKRASTIDTLTLAVRNWTPDDLIQDTQDLRRLLEKAYAYGTTSWQDEPVWIKRHPVNATYPEYTIIHDYRTPQDGNPHGSDTFWTGLARAGFPEFVLILEHDPWWTADQPGTGTATAASAVEAYDGRNLGNVDSTGTRQPATTEDVYSCNRRNIANLTDIYWRTAGNAWSANLMDAALPFAFLPAAPAAGDAVYFGIDTSLINSGPFASLVFDILAAQTGITGIDWEYHIGALGANTWNPLVIQDNTNNSGMMTGVAFDTTGVNSAHWIQSSDWTETNLQTLFGGAAPNIQGWWVRARVTAAAAATAPTQQYRDIYSVTWPYIEVASDQVGGDLAALLKLRSRNASDHRGSTDPDLYANRLVVGLRSLDRGQEFTAFVNLANTQNPPGITATIVDGATTSFVADVTTASGIRTHFNPAGIDAMSTRLMVNWDASRALQSFGSFHVYVRGKQDAGNDGDIKIRLQYLVPSGEFIGITPVGMERYTDTLNFTNPGSDWQLLDFGRLKIPLSDMVSRTDGISGFHIAIQLESTVAAPPNAHLFDIILMPVDEWAGDFVDTTPHYTEATSIGFPSAYTRSKYILVDSVTYPKMSLRALLSSTTIADAPDAVYQAHSPGEAILQANADQRLWFLAVRTSGSPYEWSSEPYIAFRNSVVRNQRYLSMRGAR